MKIFATGHRGYIGAHLVDVLKQEGHTVVGCDLGLFEGCNWEPLVAPDRELVKDIRKVEARDLDGCDCVMHLAAISNDPMGEMNAQLTFDVNRDASIRLAEIAKQAGVPRFLFAGSCSIYGKGEKLDLDENDPLNPLTAYARSKIETEQAVSELADESFTPGLSAQRHSLRPLADASHRPGGQQPAGLSHGLRRDPHPVRRLALAAVDPLPRHRPRLRRICQSTQGGRSQQGGQRRRQRENYQVRDVGDQVQRLIPSAKVVYTGEVGADPRNYRVKFDLLSKLLPDFRLQYDLASRHGGTPPQDGRAWLRQGGLRGRSVRPPPHAQGPIPPPRLTRRNHDLHRDTSRRAHT